MLKSSITTIFESLQLTSRVDKLSSLSSLAGTLFTKKGDFF